jgi:membrane-bound ClpP family serine protease
LVVAVAPVNIVVAVGVQLIVVALVLVAVAVLAVTVIVAVVVGVEALVIRCKYCLLVSSKSPTTSVVSFNFTHETVPMILLICPFDNLHTNGRLSSVQQK